MFSKFKIGFLPYQLYAMLLIVYALLAVNNLVPNDLLGGIGILAVYSLLLEECGKRIPILKTFGGKVLVVTFLPSYMVYKNLIPKQSVEIIENFMEQTNFLTVFIIFIVVGSLFSMSRKVLIKSTSKIFLALVSSQILGMIVGCIVSLLLGLDLKEAFFFIIVPVMAGGVGEGALPLSMGYAAMMGMNQATVFAQLLPCVFMGGLIGVLYAGALNRLGQIKPNLTGNGKLVKDEKEDIETKGKDVKKSSLEFSLSAVIVSIILYFVSIYIHEVFKLPVPIIVLVVVILAKVIGIIPEFLEIGGRDLYRFTVVGISPLLLFGVGVAMTPWEELVSVFSDWRIILVLFSVVSAIVFSGFFMGKMTGLHEIDSAIVISCCSGQGGTGALAILAAGDRMELMPFAQVAVRIGGAIVVTLALNFLGIIS